MCKEKGYGQNSNNEYAGLSADNIIDEIVKGENI